MAQITRKIAGDCADRSCPAFWGTDDPETTGITIRLAGPDDDVSTAGPDVPGEITGFVPTALLRAWASGQ